jgi:hypothetical protein
MLKCKGNLSALTLVVIYALENWSEVSQIFASVFISESEWSQLAYVTFKDSQGADTAVLLSVHSSSYNHF